jgi:regulatory protein
MMHKITALTVQKRNRRRVNVYLDGEYAFGLAYIVAAWLRVGLEISDEKIEQLQAEDAREKGFQQALTYLSYRVRSEAEVRQNLRKHKIDDDVQKDIIDRLRANEMVDDVRFAQIWVENRSDLRPRSRRMLAYELRQRGVDQEIIEQTLVGVDDGELAYQAALKHARKLRNLEWDGFRKKMYGFLSRRGFNYQVSSEVVNRIWEDQQMNSEI